MERDCKVLRLERKGFSGIVNFVNNLLDNTNWGNRRIATKTREKFGVDISREAIRSYRNFRNGIEKSVKESEYSNTHDNSQYYVKIAPLGGINKRKSNWKDKRILKALRD